MMSSEEEADSHAPYSDKLLKKQKRARQRVDAGEPRNSYSTLATNGPAPARAALMSGGLYGAIFEGRQHFGLFGPGYAPAEMLNELLGRAPAEAGDEASGGDIAHRVLRDILQSRKKELLRLSPDNNNVLANNNNDEPKEKRSPERPSSRDSRPDLDDALLGLDSAGDSRTSPPPALQSTEPLLAPKSEPEDRDSDAQRSSPRPLDVKRARVENIVSTMRSSPAPQQPQVNGCKKRKLYHPQQHDGAAERYGTSHGSSAQTVSDDSEDDGERPIQQKLVEKDALKSQLRTMQEQLAEMQEKYMQLCNRMGHESETIDNDGASSDIEANDDPVPKSEPPSPAKEVPPPISSSAAPNMLSQVMSKMMSAKMHAHAAAHPHLPPGFNGSLPLMPHLPPGDHIHPPHPHQHLNNAAAMYLNVSQKLFLEQEARMKEAAEQQQQQNHQQHRPQSNQHSPQQRQMGPTPKPPMSSELAERLDSIRSNAGSVGPVSGADLEGLAEVLKSEITSSLANLIDSIVTRFVHQRRMIGKQSEAAAVAAEQLNKDLLRATRMLDRKSPTPKPPERPSGQMSGNTPVHHSGAPNGVPSFITHNPMLMSQMNGPRAPGGAGFQLHPEAGGPGHGTQVRPPTGMFQAPLKPLGPLYGPMNGHFERESNPEQNEALSLVVTPKKKRHKVTDTRITPRTVSRILGEGVGQSPETKFPESPSPRPYPGGLPTPVAIPNPSLHESQVFSPYSPFFGAGGGLARSPPAPERDSPPLPHAPVLLHPALMAAAHHASPDYLRHHHAHAPLHAVGPHHPHHMETNDPHSDCNSTDLPYDGVQPTISFSNRTQHTNPSFSAKSGQVDVKRNPS